MNGEEIVLNHKTTFWFCKFFIVFIISLCGVNKVLLYCRVDIHKMHGSGVFFCHFRAGTIAKVVHNENKYIFPKSVIAPNENK